MNVNRHEKFGQVLVYDDPDRNVAEEFTDEREDTDSILFVATPDGDKWMPRSIRNDTDVPLRIQILAVVVRSVVVTGKGSGSGRHGTQSKIICALQHPREFKIPPRTRFSIRSGEISGRRYYSQFDMPLQGEKPLSVTFVTLCLPLFATVDLARVRRIAASADMQVAPATSGSASASASGLDLAPSSLPTGPSALLSLAVSRSSSSSAGSSMVVDAVVAAPGVHDLGLPPLARSPEVMPLSKHVPVSLTSSHTEAIIASAGADGCASKRKKKTVVSSWRIIIMLGWFLRKEKKRPGRQCLYAVSPLPCYPVISRGLVLFCCNFVCCMWVLPCTVITLLHGRYLNVLCMCMF
jgi:hypothetical protein